MAYTKHGHHIPRTPKANYEPLLVKKSCGGPTSCKTCNADVAHYRTLTKN